MKWDETPEEGNALAGAVCNFSVVGEAWGKQQLQGSSNQMMDAREKNNKMLRVVSHQLEARCENQRTSW